MPLNDFFLKVVIVTQIWLFQYRLIMLFWNLSIPSHFYLLPANSPANLYLLPTISNLMQNSQKKTHYQHAVFHPCSPKAV